MRNDGQIYKTKTQVAKKSSLARRQLAENVQNLIFFFLKLGETLLIFNAIITNQRLKTQKK